MDEEQPDLPLDNFGTTTEVATPPVASPEAEKPKDEQTTQPTEASGSEETKEQPGKEAPKTEDNPIAEEQKGGRPEKQDRLQNRFGELTGKIKERDGYIEQLEAQIARTQAMGNIPQLKPDAEGNYDINAVQQNQAQVAQATAQAEVQVLRQQIEREQVANRFDTEAKEILSSHKVLDPGTKSNPNPEYDPVIAEAVEEAINLTVQSNIHNLQALKTLSPKAIADKIMRGYESAGRKAASQSNQNLQALQADQAVTPNAPATPDDDDIEARLADIKF